MDVLIEIVLPVFFVIGAGYLATFTEIFDADAGSALARFVFWFAIPVLLFHSLATRELPQIVDLGYFAAYYGGVGLTFILAIFLFRLMGHADLEFRVLAGFGAIYGNTVLIGIPVILAAFGDEAALPLFLLISFHAVIFFTVVTLLVEGVARGKGQVTEIGARAAKGIITNPILVGLVAGVAFNFTGLAMPPLLDRFGELVSGAALPCALFSVGASLRSYALGGALRLCAVMASLKLLFQPFAVWVLAAVVFGVDPLWTAVAVTAAAMPTGVNAYLFALRYGRAEAENAASMLITTVVAIPVLSALLAWLR